MFDNITPVVKKLLIINIAVFILSSMAQQFAFSNFAFFNPLLPNYDELLNPNFKIWQVVTYMFLHGGLGHLFSNMFGLFIFGSTLETFMGSKKFLIYFMITGIGAALLNSAINSYEMSQLVVGSEAYMRHAVTPMVGASGAVFGILIAFGFLFPNVEMMLLFFPFPIKAKYFVTLYGLYELYAGATGMEQGVAHFAHIGGLITGFILLKLFGFDEREGNNFTRWR